MLFLFFKWLTWFLTSGKGSEPLQPGLCSSYQDEPMSFYFLPELIRERKKRRMQKMCKKGEFDNVPEQQMKVILRDIVILWIYNNICNSICLTLSLKLGCCSKSSCAWLTEEYIHDLLKSLFLWTSRMTDCMPWMPSFDTYWTIDYFNGLPNRVAQEGPTVQLRITFSIIEGIMFYRKMGQGVIFNAM